MTRMPPSRSAVTTLSTATSMKSDWRKMRRSIVMPAGSSCCSVSSARSSRAVTSIVLAPGCFCTPTITAGLPLRDPSPRLNARAFADVGDVAHQHRPLAAQRHDGLADLLGAAHAADRLEHVFLRSFGVDAGGGVLAGAAHGVEQLGQRHVVGAQRIRMRDDLELPLGAADRRHLRHAGHGQQPAPDRRVGDGAQRQRIVVRPTRSRRTGSRP